MQLPQSPIVHGSMDDACAPLSRTDALKDELEHHGVRAGWLAQRVARVMGLDEDTVSSVSEAASFHDIGKQFVDEAVLFKPGQLDPNERSHMEMHVVFGAWRLMSGGQSRPRLAAQVALLHHEWWNGGGYPFGLSGRDIPLAARITAVTDVFDALSQRRCYKPAWRKSDVMAYFAAQRARQFDPVCADAMREVASSLPADWHRQALSATACRPLSVAGEAPPQRLLRATAPYEVAGMGCCA